MVYSHSEDERILRALQVIIDDNFAKPILIGEEQLIHQQIKQFGLRIEQGKDFHIVAPNGDVVVQAAKMVEQGDADAALIGPDNNMFSQAEKIQSRIGIDERLKSYAAMNMVILDDGVYFVADTKIHDNPTAEELAIITELAAEEVKRFGIKPRVALVSHTNYGGRVTESSKKIAKALELVRECCPEIEIDGNIQTDIALNQGLRERQNPDSTLKANANVLVMPNVDAANSGYKLLKELGNGIAVGPILLGTKKPVHLVGTSATSRGIVNLTALLSASVD